MTGALLYRIVVLGPETLVAPLDDALGAIALGTAAFVVEERVGLWRVEAWTAGPPDADRVSALLADAARTARVAVPEAHVAPLPDIDWVAENQKIFRPIRAGRFFVRPSAWAGAPPAGAWVLTIDAGTAFGTGDHGTTRGCLLALARHLKKRARPRRILDLGCGTGVLGLGLALAARRRVLASDIDPEAVRVATANARANRLAALIRAVPAAGLDHPALRAGAPYDLIVANILARPLIALARPLARALAPGGRVVLSGLLAEQETRVLRAYRAHGLVLEARHPLNGWQTLTLRKPGRRPRKPVAIARAMG